LRHCQLLVTFRKF